MDEPAAALRFLEMVDHLAVTMSFDGRVQTANDALQQLTSPEIVGCTLREFVHPDDHGELDDARVRLATGVEHRVALELRVGSRRRGWRWHLVHAAADQDEPLVYAIAQDLTEARRSAARLAEAEGRFRAAFEHAPIGMSIISLDGRWLRVNPALCSLVGRSEEELLGRPLAEITHPDDLTMIDPAMAALLRGDEATRTDEKRYLRPDGSPVWVLRSTSVVREGDVPRYFISQAIDMTHRRAAQEALRISEERFRALAASAPNGVWAAELDGRCSYANERMNEITGRSAEEIRDYGWLDGFAYDVDGERVEQMRDRVLRAGPGGHEFEIHKPDGEARWVRARAGLLQGPGDAAAGIVGSLEDVTDEVANRRALAAREQELRLLTEHSSDFLARLAPTLEVRFASPACTTLLGFSPEELVGRRLADLVVEEDRPAIREAARRLDGKDSTTVACRVRRRDGRVVWFESTIAPIRDERGELTELVCVARDVTERKAAEVQLAHQAMHDALTGLPNRTLFLDRLGHALRRRVRRGTGVLAVLFLDVDRFKVVNDSLGHGAGDRLLVDVAGRLDAALRPADTVARFGGDEFTLLCEDIAGELEAVAIAQRIVDLFAEPFSIDGREVFLSTSVGIALATGNSNEHTRADDLIRDADAAMYRAKDLGKARYELFDAAMRDQAVRRLELENALRRAVERNELRMHLQPEIAVDGGAVVAFEALVRWEHPERGLLAPAEFVPLAEETGLIVPIGEWVLRRACTEAARWNAMGISVNVSARQLSHGGFVDVVDGVLRETGLDPGALCLELTESAVIESGPTTLATLDGLKRVGVKLAIDDFGTGWSSLGHLRRFPIDIVKLDRSFVSGLGHEPQDSSIAAAIISLAHALGLSTVAEGIETGEQLAVLSSLGCDLGQGFLFARPAPMEAFDDILGPTPTRTP